MAGNHARGNTEDEVNGSVSVHFGALFTVEERLETFTASVLSWPFDSGSCTPQKLAEAGFYYCGTAKSPDWVRCIVCHENVDGWEEDDDPLVEHKRCNPKCGYLKIKDPNNITVAEVLDLEKAAVDYYVSAEVVKLEADATGLMDEMREYGVQLIQQKEMEEN